MNIKTFFIAAGVVIAAAASGFVWVRYEEAKKDMDYVYFCAELEGIAVRDVENKRRCVPSFAGARK